MDYTIEKLYNELSPNYGEVTHLGRDILIADFTGQDILTGKTVNTPSSFLLRINFAAVLICTEGTLKLKLDLNEYLLCKNQMLIIIPGVICEEVEASEHSRVTLLAYNNKHLREPNSNIAIIPRRFLYKRPTLQLNERQITDFFDICKILRERIRQNDYLFKKEVAYALLQVLYLDVSNLMKKEIDNEENKVNDRSTNIYDSFMNELFKHGGVERETSFYADKLCLSPKYLSRVVKTVSGRFAKEWIRDYVILQAKTLLDSGQYTIQQVSDKLNFPNQSFFGTYFKSSVGCSPKAYMERQ